MEDCCAAQSCQIPNILILVNFEGPCNRKCWYILRPVGNILWIVWSTYSTAILEYFMNSHLVYFKAIGYILWSFGIFFPVLVSRTKRNLATLALLHPFRKDIFAAQRFRSSYNDQFSRFAFWFYLNCLHTVS
jgi:hypothetical protein